MKRWRVVFIVMLCLVLVGSVGCLPFGGGGDEEEAKPQQVEVVRGDLIIGVSGSGSIGVVNEATLSSSAGGILDEVYVEEGDEVGQGDVLAKLDTSPLELTLAQAEAALATAKYNLDKAQEAYTEPAISRARSAVRAAENYRDYAKARVESANVNIEKWTNELYQAEIELAKARQELERMMAGGDAEEVALAKLEVEAIGQSVAEAEKHLDRATLTAPFDGIVAGVYIDEGDTVAPGAPIIHLIDPTGMELEAEVDEIDIPRVRVGQKAIISVDALPELQFEGRVSYISLISTEVAGIVSYGVTIAFDIPENSDLRFGMSATVDIITSQRSSVLLVPDRAIGQDSEGNPIVRVMVGEQVEERQVVIGMSDGFQTEIIDGLHEGEMALIEVQPRESSGLFPGAPH